MHGWWDRAALPLPPSPQVATVMLLDPAGLELPADASLAAGNVSCDVNSLHHHD